MGVIILFTMIMSVLFEDYQTYLENRYKNHISWAKASVKILEITIIITSIVIVIEIIIISLFVIWTKKIYSINIFYAVDGLAIILNTVGVGNMISSYFITKKMEVMEIKDLL